MWYQLTSITASICADQSITISSVQLQVCVLKQNLKDQKGGHKKLRSVWWKTFIVDGVQRTQSNET